MTAATATPSAGADEDGKVLTIIEHLLELRRRVMISAAALVVGVGVSIWPLTKYAVHFLVKPAQDEIPGFKLHQFQLLDYWSTYFRVSLLLGIAIAMPVIMYEVLAFVAPGADAAPVEAALREAAEAVGLDGRIAVVTPRNRGPEIVDGP